MNVDGMNVDGMKVDDRCCDTVYMMLCFWYNRSRAQSCSIHKILGIIVIGVCIIGGIGICCIFCRLPTLDPAAGSASSSGLPSMPTQQATCIAGTHTESPQSRRQYKSRSRKENQNQHNHPSSSIIIIIIHHHLPSASSIIIINHHHHHP